MNYSAIKNYLGKVDPAAKKKLAATSQSMYAKKKSSNQAPSLGKKMAGSVSPMRSATKPKDNMAKSALNVATRPYRAAAKAAGKVLGGIAATPKKALGTGGAAPLMKAVAKAKRPDLSQSIERGIQRGTKNFRVR